MAAAKTRLNSLTLQPLPLGSIIPAGWLHRQSEPRLAEVHDASLDGHARWWSRCCGLRAVAGVCDCGRPIRVDLATDYPFGETLTFTVHSEQPVVFCSSSKPIRGLPKTIEPSVTRARQSRQMTPRMMLRTGLQGGLLCEGSTANQRHPQTSLFSHMFGISLVIPMTPISRNVRCAATNRAKSRNTTPHSATVHHKNWLTKEAS